MKRIYKGSDAIIDLNKNLYPIDISNVDSLNLRFYTTNDEINITKTKEDINNGILVLQWSELSKLSQGILFYDYVVNKDTTDWVTKNISEYFIITDVEEKPLEDSDWGKIKGDITKQLDLVDYVNNKTFESVKGKQDKLVSGDSIATINGHNLLTEKAITISGGGETGGEVNLDNYYTKQDIDGKGYLTEHQDISGKLDKTEAASTYQPKGNYIETIPEEYVTETKLNQKGYLTEHQDISGKQDKLVSGDSIATINGHNLLTEKAITISGGSGTGGEVNLDNYYTKQDIDSKGYLTEHQNIKTINGQSLIGTEDISLDGIGQIWDSRFSNSGEILCTYVDEDPQQPDGSINRNAARRNIAMSAHSLAEGISCLAGSYINANGESDFLPPETPDDIKGDIGIAAHAEGEYTLAAGRASHSQGQQTIAMGDYSFASGAGSMAIGEGSAAFGYSTQSKGPMTLATGFGTTADNFAQVTIGSFNVQDTSPSETLDRTKPLFVIGTGYMTDEAVINEDGFKVMGDGKVYVKGIGTYDGTNPDDTNTLQAVVNAGGGSSGGSTIIKNEISEIIKTDLNTDTIEPNKYYKYVHTVDSLTITLSSKKPDIVNEYMFEFTPSSSSYLGEQPQGQFTLTINTTEGSPLKWLGGEPITIEWGYTYQFSIINNLITGGKFK